MTQDEKNLLLQDLCARLPYNVKVKHLLDTYPSDLLCIDAEKNVVYVNHYGTEGKYKIECIRPYLRKMSDMTDEEEKEFQDVNMYELPYTVEGLDWLNAHHFDYRGLIEKGLAIEAPEGMYDSKKEIWTQEEPDIEFIKLVIGDNVKQLNKLHYEKNERKRSKR